MTLNDKAAVIRKQVQSIQFGYVVVPCLFSSDENWLVVMAMIAVSCIFVSHVSVLASSSCSFYTDQDVRERSVVEVTSAVAFDPNHAPLKAGLYDPRMGPVVARDPPCETCCRRYQDCPGHAGHIELAVPVHHPLLLGELLTILRSKCLNCHRFRAQKRQVALWKAKFQLLFANRLDELDQLESTLAAAIRQARPEDGNKATSRRAAKQAMDRALRDVLQSTSQTTTSFAASTSSYHRQLYGEMCKEAIAQFKACKRCDNCAAYSPKLRHDSSNKIFQQPRELYSYL